MLRNLIFLSLLAGCAGCSGGVGVNANMDRSGQQPQQQLYYLAPVPAQQPYQQYNNGQSAYSNPTPVAH